MYLRHFLHTLPQLAILTPAKVGKRPLLPQFVPQNVEECNLHI